MISDIKEVYIEGVKTGLRFSAKEYLNLFSNLEDFEEKLDIICENLFQKFLRKIDNENENDNVTRI
jgi:hypothetical protein